MSQTWKIPVTPAQRFVLLQLCFSNGQKLQGQQGRVFRRFMRAFKVDSIRDVLAENDNRYDSAIHRADAPALLEITAESVDYALKLVDVEHTPVDEMVVGPLFDLLEDAKAGREVAVPEGCPDFDPALDNWEPKKAGDVSDPVDTAAKQIAAYLNAAGEARAAELVERGGWDKPVSNGSGAAKTVAAVPAQ